MNAKKYSKRINSIIKANDSFNSKSKGDSKRKESSEHEDSIFNEEMRVSQEILFNASSDKKNDNNEEVNMKKTRLSSILFDLEPKGRRKAQKYLENYAIFEDKKKGPVFLGQIYRNPGLKNTMNKKLVDYIEKKNISPTVNISILNNFLNSNEKLINEHVPKTTIETFSRMVKRNIVKNIKEPIDVNRIRHIMLPAGQSPSKKRSVSSHLPSVSLSFSKESHDTNRLDKIFHRILKERKKNEIISNIIKQKLMEKREKEELSPKLINFDKDPFWQRFREASHIYEEHEKLSKTVRERSLDRLGESHFRKYGGYNFDSARKQKNSFRINSKDRFEEFQKTLVEKKN